MTAKTPWQGFDKELLRKKILSQLFHGFIIFLEALKLKAWNKAINSTFHRWGTVFPSSVPRQRLSGTIRLSHHTQKGGGRHGNGAWAVVAPGIRKPGTRPAPKKNTCIQKHKPNRFPEQNAEALSEGHDTDRITPESQNKRLKGLKNTERGTSFHVTSISSSQKNLVSRSVF